MARDLVLEVIEQVRGNALGEAAKDLDRVADKTDSAADAARDYTGDLKALDAQVGATRLRIQALGAEFVATADKATGKELRGERSLLGQLEKIRKELEDAAPDLAPAGAAVGAAMGAKAGQTFVGTFFDSVGSLPTKLRGTLMVGVVAIAAAAAPAIGASIAGAVVGAVGAGGLAGGIAAASRDPGVRAAATDFGQAISDEFFSGGQAFVGPTIESLAILQDAFADMDLGDSWERVAPYVTRIAEGVAGLGTEFMPGFNRALDRAGPGLELMAQELPQIGAALGNMVGDIAESEGALEGLLFVFNMVEGTITAVGGTITWLSNRFHDLVGVAIGVTDVLEELPIFWLQDLAGIDMAELNDGLENLRGRAEGAEAGVTGVTDAGRAQIPTLYAQRTATAALADEVERLSQEYSDYLGIQMGVDQANQRFAESMLRLKDTLAGGRKDWADNTEAGLANRAMLTNAVAALIAVRDANLKNKMPAEQATAQFKAQLDVLSELATKAGISKETLDDLVGDYYINVHIKASPVAGKSERLSDLLGFAAGGDPPIGEPFWVGEGGRPELMVLSPRPHVYSAQQSAQMVAGGNAAAAKQTALLEAIVALLHDQRRPQQQTFNILAPEGASPRETAAVVARELAWNS